MIETEERKGMLEEGYKLSPTGELIPDYDTTIKFFDEGDLIEGTVVRVDRDEVLVDVGYKSEGVIPLKELTIQTSANPKDIIEEGEEIVALVLQKEDAEGRLILSKKRADFEKAWKDIEAASKENKTVDGKVIEIVKGGLILNVGVRGFLPASLIELNRVKALDGYMNQTLECKIIEINRNRNNVVLSRKAVLNNEQRNEKAKLLEKLEKGQVIKGTISSIVDFGAFVDLGGVDGLIHISEISWEHINHPSEVVSVGQEVEVQVLDIDDKKGRVSLGLKQTQDDPWKQKVDGYEIGQVVNGKVSKILPFGVFIEFDDLEGLTHVSELSTEKVVNPKEVVEIGQEVEAKVIGIDLSRRRISLSLRQMVEESTEAPVETKEETVEEPVVEEAAEAEEVTEITEEAIEEAPAEEKKPITSEDEALLEKLAHGPTKIEDEAVDTLPNANSLEDVLEQMKKSHGTKSK